MKLNKTMKKLVAYVCTLVLVITSMTSYQAKVEAADVPEGYTLLTEEKWHPLGETVNTIIGDDNQPASSWNVYTGQSWSGVSAAVKGGADGEDTVSVFVATPANGEWGLQLGKVFQGLESGTIYEYTINYTIDNAAAVWTGYTAADENGEIKVIQALGSILGEGKTLTVTSTSCEVAQLSDYVLWLETERNLAYGKSSSVSDHKEGNNDNVTLTDGVWNKWNGNYVGTYTPGYFEVDLGQSYAASSIDQVVVWFRNGDKQLYPENGYKIQFGDAAFETVATVTEYPEGAVTTQADGAQYMVATELDKENISGNVRKVRIQIDDAVAWGAQVTEIAVYSENPEDPIQMEQCDAPAGITASSDDYNSITYTVEAGEGQVEAGYKYNVYANDVAIGESVEAGKAYTATGIAANTYTVKVISVCTGMEASTGVETTVEVKDISELITGTKNIANINNNVDAKVTSVSSYYNADHNIDTAGVGIDGLIPSGEGSDKAIRTGAGLEAEIIIDLGNTYVPAEFEKAVLAYSNPRTYAANATISFSMDGEEYTVVAENTGYECKKDNAGTAELNVFELDKLSDYTAESVRYVKVSLSGGSNGWGYVVNEIGILLNVDVDDAKVVTDKTPVEAPTITNKEYTGEVLIADLEESDIYTVTKNEGGTDVGKYDVELTLNDPDNYYWSDDNKAKETTKTLSFEITKAANEWTSELSIEGWAYGEEAKTPVAVAKLGDVILTYGTSEDGEYTATVPTNAGTYYVKAEVVGTDNYAGLEAVVKEFVIAKANQNAPEGIGKLDSTLATNADGQITGVTDAMEYKVADAEEYTAITGTTVDGLLSGTYYVRYKANDNYNASADTEVVIGTGRKLNIKLNQGTGYKLESAVEGTVAVEYGTSYSFKLTINEGYAKNSKAVVKVNGEVVEADSKGTYTVASVTKDIEVTVEGVVKDTPETTVADDTTTTAKDGTALKKATVKKATKKKAAKNVKISIKKVKGANGYRVQISTTKKFKKKLVNKIVKKRNVTIKSKKLKNKKKLYVRVKAYKLNGKKKVWAKKWSKPKKVNIK